MDNYIWTLFLGVLLCGLLYQLTEGLAAWWIYAGIAVLLVGLELYLTA